MRQYEVQPTKLQKLIKKKIRSAESNFTSNNSFFQLLNLQIQVDLEQFRKPNDHKPTNNSFLTICLTVTYPIRIQPATFSI